MGFNTAVTVVGGNPDVTAPTLTSLEIPTFVDLSLGKAGLTIVATAQDDISGVKQVIVYFDKPISHTFTLSSNVGSSNNFLGLYGIYDSWVDSAATETFGVLTSNASGVYNVSSVQITDIQGNISSYTTEQLNLMGFNTAVTVVGGNPDVTAPTLTSLEIPTFVDLSLGKAGLTIAATAQDDISGVKQVIVYFDKPISKTFTLSSDAGSSNNFLGLYGIYDSWVDNAVTETIGVLPSNPYGVYNITSVQLSDVQGNVTSYSAAQLNAIGINTSITLVSGLQSGQNYQITPILSNDGSAFRLVISPSSWDLTVNEITVAVTYDSSTVTYENASLVGSGSFVSTISTSIFGDQGITKLDLNAFNGLESGSVELAFSAPTSGGRFTVGLNGLAVNSVGAADNYIYHVIAGSTSNDLLVGGSEAEFLYGLAGDDTLVGGAGADTFVVDAGNDAITDFNNGADVLQVSVGATASVTLSQAWTAVAADVQVEGTANFSTAGYAVDLSAITLGIGVFNITNTSITGTTLTGSGLNDTLTGGSGNDTLVGGNGTNVYQFSSGFGNDVVYLTSGESAQLKFDYIKVTDAVISRDGNDLVSTIGPDSVRVSQYYASYSGGVALTLRYLNSSPSGSVTLTGTVIQGGSLVAGNTLADADGLGVISYQWQSSGVNINGATASTYTLQQSDVGKAITVVASYIDGFGTAESLSSAATDAVTRFNTKPLLTAPQAVAYIDTAGNDSFSVTSGTLLASDAENDALTYGIEGGVDAGSAVSLVGLYGTLMVDKDTGDWTYAPDDAAMQALDSNASESFTVTVSDGLAVTSQMLAVNINATVDIPTLTSKYFVLPGAGANHVDYQLKASPLSLQGQYISQAGTTGVDSIHVRAGSAIDFTASGASADKVYLDGAYGDYGVSLTGTVMTLYRGSGASYELVRVGRGVSLVGSDILVFADGSVSTWDLFNLLKSGTPLPVLGSETSLQPLGAAAPGSTLSATIKAFALDSNGENFASVGQGMQLITVGSVGVDTVYVGDGSTVDATLLGASSDLIYLRGNWGDYSKSVAGSVLTFSRLVNGHTESVKVIGGNGALNDKLIFADGAVLSNNAKLALNINLNAAIETVTGYDPNTTTPGLRPMLQASALDNVSNLDVSSAIVLSYSESVTAQAGKYIRIVDDGGAGFRGESSNHTQLIAVTDSTQVSIVGGKVRLNPTFDLDLSSHYHIEIDAGAFVGQTSGQATGAYNGSSGLNFSTVTPGTGAVASAVASQAMDASGAMVAGHNWLDIEGMGSPSAGSGTPIDLSGGNYALVAKDYDASGGNSALDYDGIQLGDFYVAANNFALGDLIYIDDQFNNLSAQNDLSLTAVLDQGTPPTRIQFAGTGLGGFIDVTLLGSTATFDSVTAFNLAVGGTAVYNPRITTPDTTAGLPLINLSSVATGVGGFVINGQCAGDWSGYSISFAGDVNGDGLADLIVGAYFSVPSAGLSAGRSYVVFGKTDTAEVNLSAIAAGLGGFVINGQCAADWSGLSVSLAGDVNGDGLADLIVGASGGAPIAGAGAGRSYVVFGKTDTAEVNLSAIAAGLGGFVINGQCANDNSGSSVSSVGDVNGDGLFDLIVGAYSSGPSAGSSAGRSYVVFGKTEAGEVNLSAIAAGSGGFVINGQCADDLSGKSVSSAGDVNGDGLADLIVGASGSDLNPSAGIYAGRSYVVFGKTGTAEVNLSFIAAGSGGFVINGHCANDISGNSVSSAGDVNGDGMADLIVGASESDPSAGPDAGRSYVVFGKTDAGAVNLSAIAAGSGGFVINGQCVGDFSGACVSSAGDVNGDGLADLIVGAYNGNPSAVEGAGRSYVVFGKTDTVEVNLAAIAAGTGGFVINGQCAFDASGYSVSSAGDVNGDGLADLFVGAVISDPSAGANAGRSYVIFGSTNGAFNQTSVDWLGTSGNDTQSDGGVAKTLVAGMGNDTLTATAASVLYGGAGNDIFNIDSNMIAALQSPMGSGGNITRLSRIDGGTGLDTITLSGGGLTFDLTQVASQAASDPETGSRIASIETIDITGSGNNTLKLNLYDVLDLGSANTFAVTGRQQLIVKGNAGDQVELADRSAWTLGTTVSLNGTSYAAWNHNTSMATLYLGMGVSLVETQVPYAAIELSAIAAGSGGFTISGHYSGQNSGSSVSSAGDVNGDGLADLIVGDRSGFITGRSFVVFGKTEEGAVNLLAIALGSGGFVINGQVADDRSGWSVSSAGDVNGDGLADLIVGEPSYGRSYVVFGKTDATSVNLLAIAEGLGGYVINGQSAFDASGYSVSSAGDVNGDGLADLIVGAHNSSPSVGSYAGRSYVVFGKTEVAAVNLSAISASSGGFVINGQCTNDISGFSVSSAGDVNGDGLADLIVGAPGGDLSAGQDAGRSYVVFGKTEMAEVNLSAVAAGSGGFVVNGQCENDVSGWSVSSAGDVNGDGFADLIVGARSSDPIAGAPDAGRSYVVLGKMDTAAVNLSVIAAGLGGYVINGQGAHDLSGWSVSSAGDVNGDGLADLMVGAFYSDPSAGADAGRSYVIFGSTSGAFNKTLVDWLGTSGNDAQSDGGVAKTLVAGMGNDTLTATAASVLYGGAGNDIFNIDSNMIAALQSPMGSGGNSTRLSRIDGGTGLDTIELTGSELTFDLTQVASQGASDPETGSRIASIETINITGSGNNTLKLNLFDVLDLGSANTFEVTGRQQLMVKGNAGDQVDLADGTATSGWTQGNAVSLESVTYQLWNHNTALATLYVQNNGVLVV
ncbi:MAG: hypothetical protein CFE38_09825 [Comamonadaceae bacterium PBBC1]|nr:MAG: hypothetical protein CFE38_09825 [Comamonadaceae bacterium PBBC1]